MGVSVFDLFRIGIGPSSSHTVGPMRAASRFAATLRGSGRLAAVQRVRCRLYGSLGATGRGHGSDRAVMLGLEGGEPDRVDPSRIISRVQQIRKRKALRLAGAGEVAFDEREDLLFLEHEALAHHPNGMRFTAFGAQGNVLLERTSYSIGGGFVIDDEEIGKPRVGREERAVPHPFRSGEELLQRCARSGLSIARLMYENELAARDDAGLRDGLLNIWSAMQACVRRGIESDDAVLPGGLSVRRRAPALYRRLQARKASADPLEVIDWVSLYALAVNEENAAGGRVVTAPTNGAAGIVPAVLHYYCRFVPGAGQQGVIDFLLTAGAIGILYKENASISGAEVGCQGEVGVACSMAAGALAAVTGGTPKQVENAAEIGMEHHLGLTCDPVGGRVQIPCIERNAIAAGKAINAARMALQGDGSHFVSLDAVIRTMRETGADMAAKYKETSRGGLAVNVVEC